MTIYFVLKAIFSSSTLLAIFFKNFDVLLFVVWNWARATQIQYLFPHITHCSVSGWGQGRNHNMYWRCGSRTSEV